MEQDKLRVNVDLDGTICEIKQIGQSYEDVKPLPGVVEKLTELREAGFTIVINTARNMQTQGHNVGKVMKNIGKITLDWLEKYQIPYDEIWFGKPNSHVIIDDRAIRFEGWDKITPELILEQAKAR